MSKKLETIALHYVRRKKIKTLLCRMATHISQCKLEPLMCFSKMNKIQKVHELIAAIPKIPHCVHNVYMQYLEYIWEKLVLDNGFNNIIM